MADNNTKIIISAEDKASAALGSISNHVGGLQAALGSLGGTLAGTLTIGGMAALIKSSIDAADAMNDLSQRVGVSVKQLAGYELAAKQSGTSMEALAKGIKGLAGNMVEHAGALKSAGITARDADGAMMQLADLFKAMPDGIEKTTLAVKLFGKSGMDLIPMLNMGSQGMSDAHEKSRLYAKRLAELAPQADQFNDQMAELGLQAKAAGLNITQYFMPGLIGMSQWLNDIAAGGEKARRAVSWIAEATNSELLGALATIMPREQGYKGPKDTLGLPASGVSGGLMLPGANSPDEIAALARARKLMGGLGGGEQAKAVTDQYTPLIKSIREKTAALGAEADAEEKRTEAQKYALKVMTDLQGGYLKLTDGQKGKLALDLEAMLAQDALATAHAKWLKQLEDEKKAQSEAYKATIADTIALEKKVAETAREVEEIGLTTEQLNYLKLARMDATIAAKEQELAGVRLNSTSAAEIDLIETQIAALRELRTLEGSRQIRTAMADEVKRQADAWKKFTDDIESSLTDALMRGFESGNTAGENFVKTLQNTLKTAALKVVVQAMVNPVMSGLQGMVGGSGSSGGFNLPMGGGGGIYDAFATSSLGADLGLSVPGMMGPTLTGEALSGMTALGSGIGAALPWIGGAMALASLGGLFEGDGLAQRTGQFVSPFAKSNAMGPSQFGAMPDGSRYNWANNHWFSGDMAPGQDQFDAALQDAEQAMINKLGLTAAQIAAIDAQIAGLDGKVYNFGTEHTDQAASGVFEAIKADRMQAIATGLGMTLQQLTDQMSGAAKTAKELAAETEKLAAEQNKAKAQALLAGMSATLSALDSVTGLRSGLMAAMAGIQGGNTYASRMGGLQELLAGETDVSRQVDLAGQIKDLVLERYQSEREAIAQNQAAAQQAAEALRAGLRSVGEYAKSLLLGNLSPLTNKQRLDEAGSQYLNTLSRAKTGDVSAVGALSGAASTYLSEARGYYASSSDYSSIFGGIQGTLAAMGLSANSVMDTTNWQAQLLAVDNEALGSLGNLTRFTENWTTNLETLLVDQTRQFEAIGVKLADVAGNTKDLDRRIAVLLDAQMAVRFDKLTAAVDKSAQTMARAMTGVVEAVRIN